MFFCWRFSNFMWFQPDHDPMWLSYVGDSCCLLAPLEPAIAVALPWSPWSGGALCVATTTWTSWIRIWIPQTARRRAQVLVVELLALSMAGGFRPWEVTPHGSPWIPSESIMESPGRTRWQIHLRFDSIHINSPVSWGRLKLTTMQWPAKPVDSHSCFGRHSAYSLAIFCFLF